MSNATQRKREADAGRVQVGKLPQKDKRLNKHEAENIKGGGGAYGGVLRNPAGEEIPQSQK